MNINITFLLTVFFGAQSFILYSMEVVNKEIIEVYSHGFGEAGNEERGPIYPDAPGDIHKAVFYTRPSVICLADFLHNKVNVKGYKSIYLVARSCGAGIAINCLYKLIYYDDAYFQETSIQSKQHAQNIVDAINNGAIELTVPLLSIKKTKVVDTLTTIGGYGSALFGGGALWYVTGAAALPLAGLTGAIYGSYKLIEAVGSISKHGSEFTVDEYILPKISNQHYDPNHIKPIDAVQYLKNMIKCPLLMHFSEQDGILANPDENTVIVYESLRMGNEDRTYIILTDDDSHNSRPSHGQYKQLHDQFKAMVYRQGPKVSGYQPTVQQLRDMIFPSIWNLKFKKEQAKN